MMPESLEELTSGPGLDRLVMPRNPLQPPDIVPSSVVEGFGALMQGPSQEGIARRSQPSGELQERMQKGIERTIDWAKVPGRAYRGEVTPEEEMQWGAKTAAGIVFDPVPAAMARLAAPVGSYALRNMKAAGKLTPVEHNPFVMEPVLGSGASSGVKVRGGGVDIGTGEGVMPASNLNKSQKEVIEMLPPPLSGIERIWQNYVKRMTPEEMLKSEPVWSFARELSAHKGVSESEAFAEVANEMFRRMGANKFLTPKTAKLHMMRERGQLVPVEYDPFESRY